jgi:hypothetical protein
VAVTDLKRLSDLTPAERAVADAALLAVPARALSEGWGRWELDEALAVHARKLGLRLKPAEKAALIAGAPSRRRPSAARESPRG